MNKVRVMTIFGTLLFMLTLSPAITLVVVVITPVSLLVANFIAKSTYSMFQKQTVTRGQQTALIDETIGQLISDAMETVRYAERIRKELQ